MLPDAQQTLSGTRRMLLNGDKSQWDRALGMPHYNATEMPAVSFETACHLVQWCKNGRFTLFDYGTPRANRYVHDGASRYALLLHNVNPHMAMSWKPAHSRRSLSLPVAHAPQ